MPEPAEKQLSDAELDEDQAGQLLALAEHEGLYLKKPESAVPPAPPKVEEPKDEKKEEPAQLPREREPEEKKEELPVETPPAEPLAEESELERLRKQNEALMGLLNESAGGAKTFVPKEAPLVQAPAAQPPVPVQKTVEPRKFVDEARFQKVFESPDELNKLLNEVYESGLGARVAPADTEDASFVAKMEIATYEYFKENPDLEPVRQYVASHIPALMNGEKPPATISDLLVACGDKTRTLLHMPVPKQVSEKDAQPSKGNQKTGGDPAFAPAPGGPRGGPAVKPAKPKLEGEQKDIHDLISFVEGR